MEVKDLHDMDRQKLVRSLKASTGGREDVHRYAAVGFCSADFTPCNVNT